MQLEAKIDFPKWSSSKILVVEFIHEMEILNSEVR